jgi:lipoprotein-releasing system permease protein
MWKGIASKKGSNFSLIIRYIGIGCIALGLAAMILSFSIFRGFKDTILNKTFSFTAHLQVSKFDLNNSYEGVPLSTLRNLYQEAEQIEGVKHIYSFTRKPALLKTKDEVMGAMLKGLGTDYDSSLFSDYLLEGRFMQLEDSSSAKEIVISKYIANKLQLKLDDDIIVFFVQKPPRYRKLKVVGIYQTGIEEFDELIALTDQKVLQKINNWADTLVGGYEILLDDFDKIDSTIEKVYNTMDYDMQIDDVRNIVPYFFDWFTMLNNNVIFFLFIILFVACLNIISVLLMMITERIEMVGTLKALGASNWQIQKIFFYNGVIILKWGLLLGNFIGIGLCAIQYYFKIIPLDPLSYYMDTVPISWSWQLILATNLLLTALVFLVLFVPTFVVTRIKAIRAIRFD